ncbi:MAG TPA: YqgE/AlgH family protein [Stellaceae bacterium]
MNDWTEPMARWRQAVLAIVALLVLGRAFAARAEEPAAEPAPGQLLIASSAMQDPRFHHSVILLLRHDATGAFGIVINRPIAEEPIAKLLDEASGNPGTNPPNKKIEGSVQVFLGGPVQPELGFILHSPEYGRPETLHIDDGLAMTASKEALRDIGQHKGPKKYLFALGYAGWGAGQLEGEIARRDWFTAPAEPELVFDTERGQVWERALARRTREL